MLLLCGCVIEIDSSDSSSSILEIALLLREGRVVVDSSSSLSKSEADLHRLILRNVSQNCTNRLKIILMIINYGI